MRIEWVMLRLNNWALYKVAEKSGSLGFASQTSYLNDAYEAGYRDSIIPIDETYASVTNDGVEAMKAARPALYECLQTYYVTGPGGIKATALILHIAPSSVHANLAAADRVLANWFTDRQSKQAKRLAQYTGLQK
jgi:hypothetical protein